MSQGRALRLVARKACRFELAFGIADEKPTDRHRGHAAAIPQRGAAGDVDEAVGSAVPETDAVALPGDFAILNEGGQLFVGLAFDRRSAAAFGLCGGKPNKLASRRKRVTTQAYDCELQRGIRWLQTRCRRPGRYTDRGANDGFAGRPGARNQSSVLGARILPA